MCTFDRWAEGRRPLFPEGEKRSKEGETSQKGEKEACFT